MDDSNPRHYTEQELRNLNAVRQLFDMWNAGDSSAFDVLDDYATWEITGTSDAAGKYTSKRKFLTNVIAPLNARLSTPLTANVHTLYADDDTVIAHFDAEATARDGLPYRNTYAWFLRFRDDKVGSAVAFYDDLAFNDLWRRVSPA